MKKTVLLTALLAAGLTGSSLFAADAKAAPKAEAKAEAKTAEKPFWTEWPEKLAEVNGKAITKQQFITEFTKQLPGGKLTPEINAQLKMMGAELVKSMVINDLMTEAMKKAGIVPSQKMAKEFLEADIKKMPKEQIEFMEKQLSMRKTTLAKYVDEISANPEAQKQIAERDFADALKAELDGISFSSEAAKRAITAEIKGAGLTLKNGKILGLNDLITQLKESDASAFIDDSAEKAKQQQAKFTQPVGGQRTPGAVTKEDFRKMSLDERIALKARDPETYASLKG